MVVATRPYFRTGGNFGSPKIDLKGCVFYAPLWRPDLGGNPATFLSYPPSRETCTLTGTTWGYQGRSFDGSDDCIEVTDSPSLQITGALTIAVWEKTTDITGLFISKRNVAVAAGYELEQVDTDTLRFAAVGLTDISISWVSSITDDGNWHFIVGSYDGSFLYLYCDGASVVTPEASTGNIVADTSNLLVATRPRKAAADFLTCSLGDVWVYNRGFSAGEVMRHYQASKWRFQ